MTTIVTAVYNNLYGTNYGGRQRDIHYFNSLKTIMRMSDAKFIIYTNDHEKLDTYLKNNLDDKNVNYVLILESLDAVPNKIRIDQLKNLEEVQKSFRCFELQYFKIFWLLQNLQESNNEYIYWIDAGLSYSGLIPDKYLNIDGHTYYDKYFNSKLFNNQFLHNLIQFTEDKFFAISKDNDLFFYDHTIPENFYNQYCNKRHIIGGLFGGKSSVVKKIGDQFVSLLDRLLKECNILYSEEQVLSAIYYNNIEMFKPKLFDLWWHEDNIKNLYDGKEQEILSKNKSFYKVLEELN
jgi:hypothetical protein